MTRTHCKCGHKFTEVTLRVDSRGDWICRQCERERKRAINASPVGPVGPHAKRFWSKVDRISDEACWPWRGSTVPPWGYGKLTIRGHGQRAHRVSYELAYGPIPKGLFVCHKCDNPGCVNPKHLFLGTHSDNMRDCVRKGRHSTQVNPLLRSGPNNGMSKLSEEAVRVIRETNVPGYFGNSAKLAKKYGVTSDYVRAVARGDRWKHIPSRGEP